MEQPYKWTKIKHDINGNPRYVIHYKHMLTEEEKKNIPVNEQYLFAVRRANEIGGRKYKAKAFPGGVVFTSYNIYDTEKHINEIKNQ